MHGKQTQYFFQNKVNQIEWIQKGMNNKKKTTEMPKRNLHYFNQYCLPSPKRFSIRFGPFVQCLTGVSAAKLGLDSLLSIFFFFLFTCCCRLKERFCVDFKVDHFWFDGESLPNNNYGTFTSGEDKDYCGAEQKNKYRRCFEIKWRIFPLKFSVSKTKAMAFP